MSEPEDRNRRRFLKLSALAAGTGAISLSSPESVKKAVSWARAQTSSTSFREIFGNVAAGSVSNGSHTYSVSGEIQDFYVEEGATVKVDGSEVSESELRGMVLGECSIGGGSGSEEDPGGPDASCNYDIPDDAINVQDYGAEGDGETDDTDAIQSAIDDANPGDTVYIPATDAAYRVTNDGSGPGVNLSYAADNLTIAGDGPESMLKIDHTGSSGIPSCMGTYNDSPSWDSITIENMVFDGGKKQNEYSFAFHWGGPRTTGRNVLVRNCVFQNGADSGAGGHGVGITNDGFGRLRYEFCTARNNEGHGFNTAATGTGSPSDPETEFYDCKSINNGGISVDFHFGHHRCERLYAEGNRFGTKAGVKSGPPKHITLRECNIRNSGNNGWYESFPDSTTSYSMLIEDCQFVGHKDTGIRLQKDGDIEILGKMYVAGSGGEDDRDMNIYFGDTTVVDASSATIISQDCVNGPGIQNDSSEPINIGTYYHAGNAGGAIDDRSGTLDIGTSTAERQSELSFVPGPNDVGAFVGCGDGSSGSDDGTTAGRLARAFSLPDDGPYQTSAEYEPLFRDAILEYDGPDWEAFRDADDYREITGQVKDPDTSHLDTEDVYDVTEYGADPSGETDSSGAIAEALSAATEGDDAGVVYLPEGTFLVREKIHVKEGHSGVSIEGEGHASVLSVDPDDPPEGAVIRVQSYSEPVSEVTLRNFRLEVNDPDSEFVRGIYFYGNMPNGESGSLVENVWINDPSGHGILLGHDWLLARGVYVSGSGKHGISFPGRTRYLIDGDFTTDKWMDWSDHRAAFAVNVFVENCGHRHESYGIDMSRERNFVSNFVVRDCYYGMKFSDHDAVQGLGHGAVVNSKKQGLLTLSPTKETSFIDEFAAIDNGNRGMRLGNDHDFEIGEIAAIGNGGPGVVLAEADFDVDHIIARDNAGAGIQIRGTIGECAIGRYTASGNGDGRTKEWGSCNIDERDT